MEPILSARTLKAIQRSSDGLSGRLFSRMHPIGEQVIEAKGLLLALAINHQWLFEANGGATAWAWNSRVVGKTNRHDLHIDPPALSQLRKPDGALLQLNWCISPFDPSLRKNHQLLTTLQQVKSKS